MATLKTKQELIDYLLSSNNFSPTSKSETIIAQLGIKPAYPIILVGGTNGKGSTCAYLTTILTNAGYKVGSFTSPHVFEYNERITVNNQPITDIKLAAALNKITAASEINLGLFKTFHLASHLIFAEEKIDIAVIEVGIGGKLDATNLFDPTISAITCVDLDHCELLGSTKEEIGLQKAGIYRPHQPAFFADTQIPHSVIDYAAAIDADLNLLGREFGFVRHEISWDFYCPELSYYSLPLPSLRGQEQLQNAALALAILTKLRSKFPVNLAQIKFGLLETKLIGRFQILPGMPQIIIDTAHNPQAIEHMLKNMVQLQFAKQNFAVFGVADDKDWRQILDLASSSFTKWFLAPLPSPRSSDPKQLKEYLVALGLNPDSISIHANVESALNTAYHELSADDRLVCFGSFLVVDAAYKAIQKVR